MMWLLRALVLLAACAVAAHARLAEPEAAPPVTYQAVPNLHSPEQAFARNRQTVAAANWAATEAHAASAQARAAEGHEAASRAELDATRSALEAKEAVRRTKASMEVIFNNKNGAEAAAKHSRQLVEKIPAIAMDAARKATGDVIAKAVKEMEGEARATVDEANRMLKAAQMNAAKMAQEEAQPFIDAKIRSEKNFLEYLRQARVAAQAATELKTEALNVAGQAGAYQAANNPVVAQTILNKAHNLMDKGMQMAAFANSYNAKAGQVRGLAVPYGLSIAAALKYGAYEGNPGGNPPPLPPLPAPLELPAR